MFVVVLILNFLRYLGKVEHYRIIRNNKDYVSADGEEFFENLILLVEVCG